MKKIYTFLLAGFLTTGGTFAQSGDFTRCAANEVLEQQLKEDPGLRQRMQAIEVHTQKYLSKAANQRTGIITIPVVVHVVYNIDAENISDCQIQSQIDVLNEDFRKLNPDNANTPAIYAGLAADAQIEFVLAKRDPNGNPTSGVTRTKTKSRSFSTNNAIKFTSQGGHDAWNTADYLNFWTAPKLTSMGMTLLGYAQFPGGNTATDGVVMAHAAFGSRAKCPTGRYYVGYDLGRTTTHEVGHYLNLRHIWGDATCGNDFVADTPTQQSSNYGCPNFPKITCGNTGDMSMNFMDYTDDPCMYMFTNGQSARMDATLAPGGFHYSLTQSLGGVAPSGVTTTPPPTTTDPDPAPKPGKGNGNGNGGNRTFIASDVSVYPNPVSSELHVAYSLQTEKADVIIEVYNLMGALVKTYHAGAQPAGNHTFSTNVNIDPAFVNLANGLYLLQVKHADGVNRLRFTLAK